MRPLPERLAHEGRSASPRIGLVVDQIDWHARELTGALVSRGATVVPVRLPACGFATQSRCGVRVDGFGDSLPDAVVVRIVPGGTFEAVTLRLGILHALRERGVMVWNDARAVERCVDKSTTSFLLSHAGIATPAAWATESYEEACALVRAETSRGPLVLKPLFGSQGRGLRLIHQPDDLPSPSSAAGGVYYLQRFVSVERDGFHDFRLLVVRDRVLAAMQRHSSHWITNVKRGGSPVAAAVNEEMKSLAIRAAACVGADFAGVDIVYGADEHPTVLEVNSMPAWSGLQQVTSFNIACAFAELFTAELAARNLRGATA